MTRLFDTSAPAPDAASTRFPMAILNGLNAIVTSLLNGLLFPFRGLPAIAGLGVVSLLTAIVLLLVVKRTSNQARMRDVKRRTQAGFFEIRLFNDDLRQILRAQIDILRHTFTYVRLSLVPLLWTIVPLTLLVAHLQFDYGYAGLEPGHSAVVTVQMRDGGGAAAGGAVSGGATAGNAAGVDAAGVDAARVDARPELTLVAPDGLRVETPGVWIPSLREMSWRIAATREGTYDLRLAIGSGTRDAGLPVHTTKFATKRVVVSRAAVTQRSPIRHDGSLLSTVLYPAEAPLPPDSPIASIAVTYPEQRLSIAGFELHWTIVFFALSLLFALALRRPLRVEI